jgi:hypothetical protein
MDTEYDRFEAVILLWHFYDYISIKKLALNYSIKVRVKYLHDLYTEFNVITIWLKEILHGMVPNVSTDQFLKTKPV